MPVGKKNPPVFPGYEEGFPRLYFERREQQGEKEDSADDGFSSLYSRRPPKSSRSRSCHEEMKKSILLYVITSHH